MVYDSQTVRIVFSFPMIGSVMILSLVNGLVVADWVRSAVSKPFTLHDGTVHHAKLGRSAPNIMNERA